MDYNRFKESPSGRVVWAGPQEARYCAFVPNPLPPVIIPDAELMVSATEAAYALGELAALGRNMANPHLLIGPFIRREAVLSSRIEGTQASIADHANSPLVRLAFIHYQFEAIHPFLDGNGRIGRLLITLLLVNWGLLPSPLLYLSAYFGRQRDRYYDLLLHVSEHGAWWDWALFFLRGIMDQARDAGARARQLQDLRDVWRARFSRQRNPALLLALVDYLFANPVVTIPGVSKALAIAYNSAQANIGKLVAAGTLKQLGRSSYGKAYVAEEILKIITEQRREKNQLRGAN